MNEEHKPHANPFLIKRRKDSIDASVLATVQLIPGVGPVKAKILLQKFGSIKGICKASEEVTIETDDPWGKTHTAAKETILLGKFTWWAKFIWEPVEPYTPWVMFQSVTY